MNFSAYEIFSQCSPPLVVQHSSEELPLASYAQMQSSSHELRTPVADRVYVYIYISKNSFAYVEDDGCSVVKYPTGMKSAGFRFPLEVFRVSSHSEELWYKETVCP